MDSYWAWSFLLLFVGLGIAVLEVFFPSGGILGFLCVVSIGTSIAFGFMHSVVAGLVILGVALVGLPAVIVLALHWLPKTPFGKHILLDTPTSDEVLPDSERREKLRSLLGKRGKAKSRMMPSGAVKIEGKTYDAVAEATALDEGDLVEVVEFQGNRLVVRALTEEELQEVQENITGQSTDSLNQPIDQIADDPFEEERTDS
jgi:membrane-bound serine protease (ClpP class)